MASAISIAAEDHFYSIHFWHSVEFFKYPVALVATFYMKLTCRHLYEVLKVHYLKSLDTYIQAFNILLGSNIELVAQTVCMLS